MIKFYYSGAPNPMKVALMLEETGLPYEAIPVDTRKGEQHKPEYPGDQSERQGAGDRRRRRHRVRFQRHPALSRREDRQIPAAQGRQVARRIAVLADVRRLRRRAVLRPVGAFPPIRAGKNPIRPQPLHVRGAAPLRHSRRAPRQAEIHGRRQPTASSTWRSGAGRGSIPSALGEEYWAKFPNLKRLVDEVSARPAAARANELRTSTNSRPSSTRKPSAPCSSTSR